MPWSITGFISAPLQMAPEMFCRDEAYEHGFYDLLVSGGYSCLVDLCDKGSSRLCPDRFDLCPDLNDSGGGGRCEDRLERRPALAFLSFWPVMIWMGSGGTRALAGNAVDWALVLSFLTASGWSGDFLESGLLMRLLGVICVSLVN